MLRKEKNFETGEFERVSMLAICLGLMSLILQSGVVCCLSFELLLLFLSEQILFLLKSIEFKWYHHPNISTTTTTKFLFSCIPGYTFVAFWTFHSIFYCNNLCYLPLTILTSYARKPKTNIVRRTRLVDNPKKKFLSFWPPLLLFLWLLSLLNLNFQNTWSIFFLWDFFYSKRMLNYLTFRRVAGRKDVSLPQLDAIHRPATVSYPFPI